jgi:hypothetical protein
MADHRKSFRPRRLAFDGRLLPRGRLIGTALVLLGALSTPALAQEIGLKNGAESLAAGKYDAAIRQLSATVNDDSATQSQAARALMLRGIAYRKAGEPGRAIADLGAAVWLGLPSSDKARALVNKGLAYKAAGLSSQGDAELAEARKASSSGEVEKLIAEDGGAIVARADSGSAETSSSESSSSGESVWSRLVPSFGGSTAAPPSAPPPAAEPVPTQTAEAAPKSGWGASVNEGASKESGNAVSRWFGSLTGDSATAASPPSPAAGAATPKAAPPPKPAAAPPSASSWAANTETQKVVSNADQGGSTAIGRWFSRGTDSASAAPVATQAASRGYTVQLANSRSQAEAQALWKTVQKSNGQLASAAPQIDKVDIGSFGTFYSLKVGPFASEAESTKLCNALKRSGTDCSVVSPDGP